MNSLLASMEKSNLCSAFNTRGMVLLDDAMSLAFSSSSKEALRRMNMDVMACWRRSEMVGEGANNDCRSVCSLYPVVENHSGHSYSASMSPG